MATFSAVFTPSTQTPTKITALAATTASSTETFSKDAILAVTATGNVNIVFGLAAGNMPTATSAGWLIASGTVAEFDLGSCFDSVAFYNPNAGTVDIYILQLVKG